MENEINSKLQSLQTEEEKTEYLLQCMDFIKDSFHSEESEPVQAFSVITKTEKSRKGDVYKRFVRKMYHGEEYIPENENINCITCQKCNSTNIIILETEQVCSNCCNHEYISINDTIGFKDEQAMEKNIVYSYKRENHFNEWICQFQAKESTSVPPEIIQNIKNELKKQKITQKSDITHTKVKEILKKLGYNKYYEHITFITTMVNGINPPKMPQELEDRLRIMFYQIQGPFDKFCPKDRINFLSYSYVLYKFCELLGEDEYLPCFPLLKSKEKLYKHDQIWKKITHELRWEFIPTI